MTTLNNKNNNNNSSSTFNVVALAYSLYNEFVQNRPTHLVDDALASIQVDSSRLGDMMSWYDARGLDTPVLKGEDRLSSYDEFQTHIKEIANNPNDDHYEVVRRNLKEIKSWAKTQWEEACVELDRNLCSYDPQEVEVMNDTREDIKIVHYLEIYAPLWGDRAEEAILLVKKDWDVHNKNVKMLKKAKDGLFERRNDTTKPLSYDLYVRAMLLVTEQLERLGKDNGLHETFLEMQWNLQSVQATSVREESVASMSIDMESALDLKRAAEKIAKRHNVSVHEAFLMLQAGEDMTHLDWVTDIAEEEDYLDDFVVESDNE
jgi:hypothetical protein